MNETDKKVFRKEWWKRFRRDLILLFIFSIIIFVFLDYEVIKGKPIDWLILGAVALVFVLGCVVFSLFELIKLGKECLKKKKKEKTK